MQPYCWDFLCATSRPSTEDIVSQQMSCPGLLAPLAFLSSATTFLACLSLQCSFGFRHRGCAADTSVGIGHNLLSSCRSGEYKTPQNSIGCCHSTWLPPRRWKENPVTEDTTYFGQRTWKEWSWTWPGSLSPEDKLSGPHRAMQAAKGKEQPAVQPSWSPCEHRQWPGWQGVLKRTMVALKS